MDLRTELTARQAFALYDNVPYRGETPHNNPDWTRDDLEFVRSKRRNHTVKTAPAVAEALRNLLSEVAEARALLVAWDEAAAPDEHGFHNAGGFALNHAEEIRETLRKVVQ